MVCNCCNQFNEKCGCSGQQLPVPQAVSATITLGSRIYSSQTPPYCTDDQARTFIEGTYVLPFYVGTGSQKTYLTTLSNGMIVAISWFCDQNPAIFFSVDFCGESGCFAYVAFRYQFASPSLCYVTYGDTTPITASTTDAQAIRLLSGALSGCLVVGDPSQRYIVSLSLVPQW